MSIEGKKIFITGSTGGIGTAICNKFLNKNCILVLTSSSDENLYSGATGPKVSSNVILALVVTFDKTVG